MRPQVQPTWGKIPGYPELSGPSQGKAFDQALRNDEGYLGPYRHAFWGWPSLVIVLLTWLLCTNAPAPAPRIHINPVGEGPDQNTHVAADLCSLIDASTTTLDAAFYELSLPTVAACLVRARMRGVRVRLFLERDNARAHREAACLRMLEAADIPLGYDDRSTLMHNKFVVVDQRYTWTGAVNPTWAGCFVHRNEALRFDCPALAQAYEAAFAALWEHRPMPRGQQSISCSDHTIKVSFDPTGGREHLVLDALGEAHQRVDVLAFSLTHRHLVQALEQLAHRGVHVRIGLDEHQLHGREALAAARTLVAAGCELGLLRQRLAPGVRLRFGLSPHQDVKLHFKLLLIDECCAVTGSANLSTNGWERNDESVLALRGSAVQAYPPLVEKCMGMLTPWSPPVAWPESVVGPALGGEPAQETSGLGLP